MTSPYIVAGRGIFFLKTVPVGGFSMCTSHVRDNHPAILGLSVYIHLERSGVCI